MKLSDCIKGAFFLVVGMLTIGKLAAQAPQEFKIAGKSYIQLKNDVQHALPTLQLPSTRWLFYPLADPAQKSILNKQPESMPKAYAFDELGFFCKWEVKMEKAAKIPVKFRLGEVQYVERMEGKLPQKY